MEDNLLKLDITRFDNFKIPYDKVAVNHALFELTVVVSSLNVWYKTAILDVEVKEDLRIEFTDEDNISGGRYFILHNLETDEFNFSIFTHDNKGKETDLWLTKGRYEMIDSFFYKNFREHLNINVDDLKINSTIGTLFKSDLSKGGFIDEHFSLLHKIKDDSSVMNLWKIFSYANLINIALIEYVNSGNAISVEEMDKDYMVKVKSLAFSNPKFNVQDIADELQVPKKSLSYYYKKEMGQTINKMILENRLNYSKMLLSNNKETISEIAYNCGYEEIQSFTRFFKNATGKSPSEYKAEFENK